MPPWDPSSFRRRLVGMYALTVMEREGPVHGYGLSERIDERTEGAWRPGPGAVYPSLTQLVASGFARARTQGRRRVYTITPKGRRFLATLRRHGGRRKEGRPDLGALWAEVMGVEGIEGFLVRRLHHSVDAIEAQLARSDASERLRERALAELSAALERLGAPDGAAPSREVPRAR